MADQLATIKIRRDAASNWADADPVLAAGELGIVTDTREAKLGDGFTVFSALPVWLQDVSIAADLLAQLNTALTDHIDDADIHYADAPEDGKPYVRQSGAWVENTAELPAGNPGDTLRVGDDRNWESTDALVLDNDSGNVGIGTDAPSKKLSISVPTGANFFSATDEGGGGDFQIGIFGPTATISSFNSNGGEAQIFLDAFSTTLNNIRLRTGGEDRLRINGNGSVGVNCDPPTSNLFAIEGVGSTADTYSCVVRNSVGDVFLATRDDGAVRMDGVNSVFVTSSAPNVHINQFGFLYKSTSSRRYKREIADMPYGLAEALSLRPVIYKGTGPDDGEKIHGGMIAEEVHEAGLTDFVEYNTENEPDSLEYGNMVALAFKAVQELNDKVETLMARLEPNQKDPKNA